MRSAHSRIAAAELLAGQSLLRFEEGREFGGLALVLAWTLLGSSRQTTHAGKTGGSTAPLIAVAFCAFTAASFWLWGLHHRG